MRTRIWTVGIIALVLFAQAGLVAAAGPEGEPEMVFDNNGTIDRIANNDIVLDDSGLELASNASFFNKDGSPAFRSSFKAGVRVDYHLNNLGQVDALRLAD